MSDLAADGQPARGGPFALLMSGARCPATTVVAPAIGNAIFAAVGLRLRHLPIRATTVRRSLTQKS